MDSNIVRALVAEFGLDLLKFNDDIRLGTLVPPANCSKSTATDTENIKAFYAEASRTEVGRSALEANAKLMSDRIQEQIFKDLLIQL